MEQKRVAISDLKTIIGKEVDWRQWADEKCKISISIG